MEPGPDLMEARAAWRDALRMRESMSADQLRELETHLDDAMTDLEAHGLSAEEAFLIGTRRMGAPAALGAEFQKAGSHALPSRRARWMLLGILVYAGAVSAARVLLDLGALASVLWRDVWLVRLFVPLSYLAAAAAGVWVLRSALGGRSAWLSHWMHERRHLRAAVLVLIAAFGIPPITRTLITVIAARTLPHESLGYMVSWWSMAHWLSTAVCLGVLILLLRRYWHPQGSETVIAT